MTQKIKSKFLKIRVALVKRNEPNISRHELTTVVQHLYRKLINYLTNDKKRTLIQIFFQYVKGW